MRPMQGVRNMQNIGMQPQQVQRPQQVPQTNTTENWNEKKKSFNRAFYDTLPSREEKSQYLGEIFWPFVALRNPELKRKITGFMIWNFDHEELIKAINDEAKLEEIYLKSKKSVDAQK